MITPKDLSLPYRFGGVTHASALSIDQLSHGWANGGMGSNMGRAKDKYYGIANSNENLDSIRGSGERYYGLAC